MELEKDMKFEPHKGTFLLNTNKTCFLCLSTNHSFNDGCGNQDEVNRVSLLSISRYLGMSLKDLFSNSLEECLLKENDIFPEKISNCSVTLCEGCALITSRLSRLCVELEVLQMKVDHCLQSFQDELENSEVDIVRVEGFQKMQSEQLEHIHMQLADTLRKKMKKQCDTKLNCKQPKVIIKSHPKTKRRDATKQYICATCQPPRSIADGRLHLHELRAHVDILMSDSKLATTSSEDFKIYANHVYKVEISSSKKAVNSKGEPICYCPHCPKNYKSLEVLKGHLYYEHYNILSKKLISLQKSSTVQQIQSIKLLSMSMSRTSGKKFHCDKCRKPFKHKNGLTYHKSHHCKFGPKPEPPPDHHNHRCEQCGKVYFKRRFLLDHKRHSCEFGPKLPCSKTKKKPSHKCPDCGQFFRFPSFVKAHQKRCRRHLESGSTSVADKPMGKHKQGVDSQIVDDGQQKNLSYHSENTREGSPNENENKATDKWPSRQKTTCTLCKPPSEIKKRGLLLHKIRKHIDNYMSSYKLPTTSYFKVYCDHVLKVELIVGRKNENFNCAYCPMNYKSHNGIQLHLFTQHKQILGKKIIELQKSTTIDEIQAIKLSSLEKTRGGDMAGTSEVSIEIENDGDEEELYLKRENVDEFDERIDGNDDDLQQEGIMDVDIEKDGFVVKTEHFNENLDVILPDIPDDDPLKL